MPQFFLPICFSLGHLFSVWYFLYLNISTFCLIDPHTFSRYKENIFNTANGSSVFPTDTTTMSFTHMWWSLWVSVAKAVAQLPDTWHASLFLYYLLLTACQWFTLSRETSLQSTLFAWRENNVDMIRSKAIGTEAAKKSPHAHTHMHFVVVQALYFPGGCQGFFNRNKKNIAPGKE